MSACKAIAVALALASASCASARVLDAEADRFFRDREFARAAEHLGKRHGELKVGAGGGAYEDELLYLLDWAVCLHEAGQYETSNGVFALAEKHVWGNDYTSVTEEAGTLLTGENTKVYRGEDFEKILINVYKSINFALLGKTEEALVEARLVDRRLGELKRDGEGDYKQNAFARYLSGILYESQSEWNDAYIDYRKTHEILPQFAGVGPHLLRMAGKMGMRDHVERWERQFGLSYQRPPRGGASEIVVLYQNGRGPRKVPREDFHSLPRFSPDRNPVREAEVLVNGELRGRPALLHDVEATAIANLDERIGGMLAKRIAGRVAKELAAREVERRTDNPALGLLTRVVLIASDQADLRSWSFLPRDLQILRIEVPPGEYDVKVRPIGAAELPPQKVRVDEGQKKFVSFRYVP